MRKDVTRAKAQKVVTELLGPDYVCRKKSKTVAPLRKEIGRRGKVPPFRVKVVGAGATWLAAMAMAGETLEIPELTQTAIEIIVKHSDPT